MGQGSGCSSHISCRSRMRVLVLLLWTGGLLGHSNCQSVAGSSEVSRGGRAGGGISRPSPSLTGCTGDRTGSWHLGSKPGSGLYSSKALVSSAAKQRENVLPHLSGDRVGTKTRSKKVKIQKHLNKSRVPLLSRPFLSYWHYLWGSSSGWCS